MSVSVNAHQLGFGEHIKPCSSYEIQKAKELKDFFKSGLFVEFAVASCLCILTGAGVVAATVTLAAVTVLAVGGISAFMIARLCHRQKIFRGAGIVQAGQDNSPKEFLKTAYAFPTKHSAETVKWRKRLVKAAKENIVISGNYCGGKTFDDLLDVIREQLEMKPQLKVVILSSSMYLGERVKLDQILKEYPERVQMIKTDDVIHYSSGVNMSTNHTKCVVIDSGKYFILGGSGITDAWTDTGTENEVLYPDLQKKPGLSVYEKIIPIDFRDTDTVFRSVCGSKAPIGIKVYKQMLRLASRWEHLNAHSNEMPIENESVTQKLLSKPKLKCSDTEVYGFFSHKQMTLIPDLKIYAAGPEHKDNPFFEEIIQRVEQAKKRIMINHMFFHPPKRLMDALIRAAHRGVKMTLITNNVHATSPYSHHIFGPRNQYNYTRLINALPKEIQPNVSIYEYTQNDRGSHKKVIIVDDAVLAGNGNLGYKTLEAQADHELHYVASSKGFAEKAMLGCQEDIRFSVKKNVKNLPEIGLCTFVGAKAHEKLAHFIG